MDPSIARSSPWTDPGFLAAAHAWIRSHVEVEGEIVQTHVQRWSTVLRVPAVHGTVWCKAASDQHRFEPRLIQILADLRPEAVPELVATDVGRGWMLTCDGGTRLRELIQTTADVWRWERFLPGYGELQIAAMPRLREFLDIGVPDERLDALPARVDGLLGDPEFLMLDQRDGLTTRERDRLRALLPEVEGMCRELAGAGVPETIQHDDLNDGNVFVREGHARTFDWGDACVSHPFHSLTVLLRAAAYRLDLTPGGPEVRRLRDAYLEPFSGYGARDELIRIAELAYRTGTLGRALAWHRYLAALPPEERADDLEAVPYGLRKFLEAEPLGSWR
jgi:hypothetical protein